jgi:hypothetical protein
MDWDSSVGTPTGYGLEGPTSILGSARIFSTASRPTLGSTQPPVPGAVSLGDKAAGA